MSATEKSISEMKEFLRERGIDFRGCLEKSEFAALVDRAIADGVQPLPKSLPKYPLVDLLGPTLVDRSGKAVPTESLRGKRVGLYFSASWCPPCQQFTPHLAGIYKRLAASNPGQFEVVFVSSDRDEMSFSGYYAKMPWLALPFAARAEKERTASHHRIRGIPSLILYDANGQVYQKDGVNEVAQYPDGFPWD